MDFRSNGKILLTGEYAVLDGAKALALPIRFGQSMKITELADAGRIEWSSLDENGQEWFSAEIRIQENEFQAIEANQKPTAEEKAITTRLLQIFNKCFEIKPDKFRNSGFQITTKLDFKREWGLGTSSTLIYNLSQWLEIDPYLLLKETFGGSGYDIAAASHDLPITFQLTDKDPAVFVADFHPAFKNEIFFVYLNRKQNSREAIARYRNQDTLATEELTLKISGLTEQIIQTTNIEEFKILVQAHETLISKAIDLPKVKNELFPDFNGCIKSLGGWGGDFILATGKQEEKDYFRSKGYHTIFDYSDLIL